MRHWLVGSWFLPLLGTLACTPETIETPEAPPPPVYLDTVSMDPYTPTSVGTAELEPVRSATLAVEAPGRVLAVNAQRGQRVRAGDVIVRLDVGRTSVAAQAASASVTQAEAALAQARREHELTQRLQASGAASQRSLDNAADAERLAAAALEAAQAQVRVSRRGLTEAILRAPFDGQIAERRVEVGEYLVPGAPVAVLIDNSELIARVLLDPREALDVEPGARARVEVFARPNEIFDAEVLRISDLIDSGTRRLPVELSLGDVRERLRPGLMARFTVDVGPEDQHLTVDADAVFERFEQTHVYVVGENDIAVRRRVELGSTHNGRALVLDGLETGERVVVQGQDRVLAGQPVSVEERQASPEEATPDPVRPGAPGAEASEG